MPRSGPTLQPNPEILWHWTKWGERAGAFPAQPPQYCRNLACSIPPTRKKCPEVTLELKHHGQEIRRKFTIFHLKLISLVFHSYFSLSNLKEPPDLHCPRISECAGSIPDSPTVYQGNPLLETCPGSSSRSPGAANSFEQGALCLIKHYAGYYQNFQNRCFKISRRLCNGLFPKASQGSLLLP